jgi:hypothetical protein
MDPKYVFKPGAQKVVEDTIYEKVEDPVVSSMESEPDSVTVGVGAGQTATFQINQSTGKVEVSYSNPKAALDEYIGDIAELIIERLNGLVTQKAGRRRRKSKHARKSKHKTRRR